MERVFYTDAEGRSRQDVAVQNLKNRASAIRRDLDRGSIGSALEKTYELACASGSDEVARWSRLELEGYYGATVPEYRTVPGQHYNIYGQLFVPPDDLGFLNELRVPFAIAELERLAESCDQVSLHHPGTAALIREYLAVGVHMFRFSAVHLQSVFAAIRLELLTRVGAIPDTEPVPNPRRHQEDVLLLRPNVQGVGLDLRALWRRIRTGD